MPPNDRRAPASSRAEALPPNSASRPTLHSIPSGPPRNRISGGGADGGDGDHERRICSLEGDHQDLRELLHDLLAALDAVRTTLGREPSDVHGDEKGSGLLGAVARINRDRADVRKARGWFWSLVAGVGALGGAAGAASLIWSLVR